MKYNCNLCNKKHQIYFAIKAPINETLQELINSNSSRIVESDGIYLLDKKQIIIEGIISMTTEYKENFNYITWVNCDAKEFVKMSESFENGIGSKLNGSLVDNLIPYNSDTKNLNCQLVFRSNMTSTDKPNIVILEDSQLRTDQINGLSIKRVEKLMNEIHHSSKNSI